MQDERPSEETLKQAGENAIIEHLTKHLHYGDDVVAGPGDDCAVIQQSEDRFQLLKTDSVIEQVHFLPNSDPEKIGWKAAARVVSDFAAMGGGQPQNALITLISPGDRRLDWARNIYRGLERCAQQFEFSIVGGETSQSPAEAPIAIITVAMSGEIENKRCVFRSGARIGDAIYVTGRLGGSISGKPLQFIPRLREAGWLTRQFSGAIHAMMDLSDGLAKDLPRLATASKVGFRIDRDQIPCNEHCTVEQALRDGEDYELLFTADPDANLETDWKNEFPDLPLTQIGRITDSSESENLTGGWDPFEKD